MAPLLVSFLLCWMHCSSVLCSSEFTREDFPADFVFGAGTSAFQWLHGRNDIHDYVCLKPYLVPEKENEGDANNGDDEDKSFLTSLACEVKKGESQDEEEDLDEVHHPCMDRST
ncbi:Beta-glucosidase 4 [Platanthera guangdongensis]|uniref:Beta-glucosidase 4 n=1 Tax=Platanthera guangdongensis TaxID=2320717 RepID=A0ABR2M8I0_9ASPA